MESARSQPGVTARQVGLVRCRHCGRLQRAPDEHSVDVCQRCGATLQVRTRHSLQRTWAFLLCGLLAYIPANVFPIMSTRTFSSAQDDTIVSGVIALFNDGSYFVSLVVFVASIVIPVAKFLVIAGLASSLHFEWTMSEHTRHKLHTVIEFIGRWSMVDVFVVAVLAALLQLGAILSITPGFGINAFAASVVMTMLAASSLDSRLIWDQLD